MALALSNRDQILRKVAQSWHHFRQAPYRNVNSFAAVLRCLRPILLQTILYGYIFAFCLPKFMVTTLGIVGNHAFLRGILRNPHYDDPKKWNIQECLAASLGPGLDEISTAVDKETYGKTVGIRSRSTGELFWQQTAYYRHGLGTGPWRKSAAMLKMIADAKRLEIPDDKTRITTGSTVSEIGGDSLRLKWPTTVIWGTQDIVLREEIYLSGLDRCLGKESELILLPRSGHWVPLEAEGCAVFGHVIEKCASPEVPEYFRRSVQSLYPGALVRAQV